MKRRPGYLLRKIAGTDYLLPYGQRIADHKNGVSLNSTGLYIWNLLERERSREELRAAFLAHFMTDPAQKEEMLSDLDQFLGHLVACQILEDDTPFRYHTDTPTYLEIGGLVLEIDGPKGLIDTTNLKAFCIDPHDCPDQRISIIWDTPGEPVRGTILIRNHELVVCEGETDYRLLFPTFRQIYEVALSKDGKHVTFYCEPYFIKELAPQFFHALRHTFLYLAQRHHRYAIHSASLRYQNKAWLFSAASGTGKSTHTNLWKELYGTTVLNGDLNLLAIDQGRPVIYGIPWCGTSEIFDQDVVPLGGIILLKRAATDHIVELSPDQQALMISQRFISPVWTDAQLEENLTFAEELAPQILVCQLRCTKNNTAAEVMKQRVDAHSRSI